MGVRERDSKIERKKERERWREKRGHTAPTFIAL